MTQTFHPEDAARDLLHPQTVHDLTRIAAATARSKGFANWSGDGIPLALALIHDELSEASEAQGSADTAEELADVIIRTLNLAHDVEPAALTLTLMQDYAAPNGQPPTLGTLARGEGSVRASSIEDLHVRVSRALRVFRSTADAQEDMPPLFFAHLAALVVACARTIHALGQDPCQVVRAKMTRNLTRPHRHGGKRL